MTGLTTTVNVLRRVHQTGRQVAAAFNASLPIVFDAQLPKWNYLAIPHPPQKVALRQNP